MSVFRFRCSRGDLLRGSAVAVALGVATAAAAQNQLPEVVVTAPKEQPKPTPRQAKHAAPTTAPVHATARATAPVVQTAPVSPAAQLNAKGDAFDGARSNLFTTIGTASTTLTQSTIQALPGGDNAPVERILLQFPGVTQDSAASGDPPRPQRPRQPAIPHQRRHAARRPDRLRQHSRCELDRQPQPRRRRTAGRIWLAHGGLGRHHHPHRPVQQQRSDRRLRRQPRNHHAIDPIRRHLRQHLSGHPGTASRQQGVAERRLLCRRAVLFHRPLSVHQLGPGAADRRLQSNPRHVAAGERFCLPVDLRRPLHAAQPARRHIHRLVSNSQQSGTADAPAGERVRRHELQFRVAQREPVRRYAMERAGVAAVGQRF